MSKVWSANSWNEKELNQIFSYPDPAKLDQVKSTLHSFPPLVSLDEINLLKSQLARVCEAKAFLLQGGDCAESFSEFKYSNIKETFRVLLQMAGIFTLVGNKQVIRIGRFAGQFAKPRSSDYEIRGDHKLPSYRGDIINSHEFSESARQPDPERILRAYFQSAATLNFLRTHSQGRYTNLKQLLLWTIGFIENSVNRKNFSEIEKKCRRSLQLLESEGASTNFVGSSTNGLDFFCSHEALHLHYEEALTHQDPVEQKFFASSAHFLWVGNRTRQPHAAHVEYLRGIANPIGIKCGPGMSPQELKELIETLNPRNEAGKINLISRMGKSKIEKNLTPLIQLVKDCRFKVIWSCDPMHGNTFTAESGHKTRLFEDIKQEIEEFFSTCRSENVYPGGIHLEMTGQDVTECLGGSQEIDLHRNYQSFCDPRLNGDQAVELAFQVSDLLKNLKDQPLKS